MKMSSEGPIVPACLVHVSTMHGSSFNGKVNNSSGMMYLPKIHDYNQNVTATNTTTLSSTTSSSTIDLQKKERANSLQRFFSSIMGKGRRKSEKDAPSPNPDEQREYLENDYIQDKISDCDLNQLVTLPVGLDYNEWLATHTISFYEHVNLMYGTVSEFCSKSGCSSMTAPSNTQYLYVDEKNKKCKCAAPDYVNLVMSDCQKSIKDESVFPTKYGNVFPAAFESVVRRIHRHLFHVIAHIYHAHFKEIAFLKLHPHLNTLFQHFMTFNRKHNMLDEKETEVLEDLFVKLEGVISTTNKVPSQPSSPKSNGSGSRSSHDIASNGAVITSSPSSGGDLLPPPPENSETTQTSASLSRGNQEHQPGSESNSVLSSSVNSSPTKCADQQNHHSEISSQLSMTNTSVPRQQQHPQWPDGSRSSTPSSGSPSKYATTQVTTTQPQAQSKDPNLIHSILSS